MQTVHVTTLSLDIDDEYEERIGFCLLDKRTDEEGGQIRNLADLQPIPLSPEILEAAGFVDGEIRFSYHTHLRVEPYSTSWQGIFPGEWSVLFIATVPY